MILRPQKPPRRGELTRAAMEPIATLAAARKTAYWLSEQGSSHRHQWHVVDSADRSARSGTYPSDMVHGKQFQGDFTSGAELDFCSNCSQRFSNKRILRATSIGIFILLMVVWFVPTNMRQGQKGGARSEQWPIPGWASATARSLGVVQRRL